MARTGLQVEARSLYNRLIATSNFMSESQEELYRPCDICRQHFSLACCHCELRLLHSVLPHNACENGARCRWYLQVN